MIEAEGTPVPRYDYSKQMAIADPARLDTPVTIVGVGSIGSFAALALAKMGCSRLTVYDHDMVALHNLPVQAYGHGDLGRSKVDALADLVAAQTGVRVVTHAEAVTDQVLDGIVIAAVDTMAARARIWSLVRRSIHVPLFIDARMGAEVMRIYSVLPLEPDWGRAYEATLYSDEEASADPCSEQAISFVGLVIAGLVGRQVARFADTGECDFEIVLDTRTLTLLDRVSP